MPFYQQHGKVPAQRHTAFYKNDGKSLYREELFSTKGFSGIYSLLYHCNMPTQVLEIKELPKAKSVDWEDAPLQYYHFFSEEKKTDGNFINSRNCFLENSHCRISTANVSQDTENFFRNAYHHEMIFVHHGQGSLFSEYGDLKFKAGDYLIIPKGCTYQIKFEQFENNKLFITESNTPFDIPKHFRNEYGQLLEHAPYYERDFRAPEYMDPIDKQGDLDKNKITLILKANDKFYEYSLANHPFDVAGWDGFVYPYAFNIKDYAPIVGKLHMPPPVHLVFTTQHFVVCNFVPRLFDFHPQAIPAPYFHSNVDSDEVLYYVEGNFMSRSGIKEGSITMHPGGIPHGPQPGKTEASIGRKEVYEYAVMIDTFSPLKPTLNVKETMVNEYPQSWLS